MDFNKTKGRNDFIDSQKDANSRPFLDDVTRFKSTYFYTNSLQIHCKYVSFKMLNQLNTENW